MSDPDTRKPGCDQPGTAGVLRALLDIVEWASAIGRYDSPLGEGERLALGKKADAALEAFRRVPAGPPSRERP